MAAKLPFVGPAYRARSRRADAQRCVNLFLEYDDKSPRAPLALYGTPGLLRQWTFPAGPVRGAVVMAGNSYWVAGNAVYRRAPGGAQTTLGVISTSTGRVGIVTNGAQVLIVDGAAGWIATAGALTQIADSSFPNGVTAATYQDGYFIVAGDGSGKFYLSDLLDGSAWDALDFGSAESSPDALLLPISDHRELWLFGETTIEPWQNTGNASFPFQRVGNTTIEKGLMARFAVVKADNSLFWIGRSEEGAGSIWRANGYAPQRISTHAIEFALAQYPTLADATGFAYEQEGHLFIVFSFPSGDATWVYDVSTGEWHERAWLDTEDGTLHRWRGDVYLFWNGLHLVGDHKDGRVYSLDLDVFTDDGDPMVALRTSATQSNNLQRVFYTLVEVDAEMGVGSAEDDPEVRLRWSDDGGYTWSNYLRRGLGKIGQFRNRVQFFRLGCGRQRVFEVSITDDCRRVILGATVEAQAGGH